MKVYQISKNNISPNRWDGGLTFEYFIFPVGSVYSNRNFDFRISSATIDKIPSNFTKFEGYQRYLVMLDNDLQLERNGINEAYQKHEIFEFISSDEVTSFSKGSDFNLMLHSKFCKHRTQLINENCISTEKWIILFSLQSTKLYVDRQEFILNDFDCLVIDNFENKSIPIKIQNQLIFAAFS